MQNTWVEALLQGAETVKEVGKGGEECTGLQQEQSETPCSTGKLGELPCASCGIAVH